MIGWLFLLRRLKCFLSWWLPTYLVVDGGKSIRRLGTFASFYLQSWWHWFWMWLVDFFLGRWWENCSLIWSSLWKPLFDSNAVQRITVIDLFLNLLSWRPSVVDRGLLFTRVDSFKLWSLFHFWSHRCSGIDRFISLSHRRERYPEIPLKLTPFLIEQRGRNVSFGKLLFLGLRVGFPRASIRQSKELGGLSVFIHTISSEGRDLCDHQLELTCKMWRRFGWLVSSDCRGGVDPSVGGLSLRSY